MADFYSYLKKGFARPLPVDRIGTGADSGILAAAFGFLKPHLNRHRCGFLVGLLLVGAVAVIGFAPPLLTRYLVDEVILMKQLGLLAGVVLLLSVCVAGEKLIGLLEKLYFARLEQRIIFDIQNKVLSRLLRLPMAFFDEQQTGYLTSRITADIEGLRWLFSSSAVRIFSNALRFIGGLLLLLYLEWRLALAILLLLPVLIVLLRFFSSRIYILAHQRLERKAETDAKLQETLSAALLIKAFAIEDTARRDMLSRCSRFFQSTLEQIAVSSLADLLINLLPSIARGVALTGGAVLIIQDQWTLGGLLAFIAYLGFVFGPAQYLATANLQFQKALAALSRVSALIDVVPEENISSGIKTDHLNGEIEFKHVDFDYNGRDTVLNNICLHVRPGERVAIVGPSGVGKTSLVSLLLGFYRVTAGLIYYDGLAADEYDVRSLRRRIGYVSQQPQLLTGTIMDNLCYGYPDADRDGVFKAAMASGIHDFVKILPDGYESVIGENGLSLSEGQKQRLSLARALIKDPDILVLDEPTASLDDLTEQTILESMASVIKNKTAFIVTHSLAVVQKCDLVLLLDSDGRLTQGTHAELNRTNALYCLLIGGRDSGSSHNRSNSNGVNSFRFSICDARSE